MKIAISACLMGVNCKYDGSNNRREPLVRFLQDHELLLICPETVGEMPTPRIPSEIREGRVISRQGDDVTSFFDTGVARTVEEIEAFQPDLILLKANSPSCGKDGIYDGTFSGKIIREDGWLARALQDKYPIITIG